MHRWLSGLTRNSSPGRQRVTGTATFDFSGKVALITGGTEGIGLAAALAFVAAGVRVLVVGRDHVRGEKALGQLNARGGDARFLPVDASEPLQVERMVAN